MKTAVITGAGGGIGQALAVQYVARGWRVIGIDRSEQGLAETEGLTGSGHKAFQGSVVDLLKTEERLRVVGTLQRIHGADLIIHNAGINRVGRFVDIDFATQRRVIELNLLAPMQLTALMLKHQGMHQGGTFVFLSSLSWFTGYPGASVYAASKDAIAHYARSLRIALASQDINVLTVFPGATRTAMAAQCSPQGERGAAKRMAPIDVAAEIARAVERRQATLVPGRSNRVYAGLARLAPRLAERAIKSAIYDRLNPEDDSKGLSSDDAAASSLT